MSWKVLLILMGIYVVYVVLGGVVFWAIEKPAEDIVRTDTRGTLASFLTTYTCVPRSDMEAFITAIIDVYDNGVLASNNATSPSKWEYPAALFFANTVVTTIGYGNISPSTRGGRIFCVFFALFGIPLTAMMLAGVGEKLNNGINKLMDKCQCNRNDSKACKLLLPIAMVCGGVTIMMILPSGIFVAMEGWTFAESMYYCFITLTTIGFGDFVAGQNVSENNQVWYRLLCWLWIGVGLAWLAMLIGRLQASMQRDMEKIDNKLKKEKGENNEVASETEMGSQSKSL